MSPASGTGRVPSGLAGSLVTDADRTYLGVFHPEDLAAYARQHGISPAEAASRLNRELTSAVDEKWPSSSATGH
jgi:hypothetical protein